MSPQRRRTCCCCTEASLSQFCVGGKAQLNVQSGSFRKLGAIGTMVSMDTPIIQNANTPDTHFASGKEKKKTKEKRNLFGCAELLRGERRLRFCGCVKLISGTSIAKYYPYHYPPSFTVYSATFCRTSRRCTAPIMRAVIVDVVDVVVVIVAGQRYIHKQTQYHHHQRRCLTRPHRCCCQMHN